MHEEEVKGGKLIFKLNDREGINKKYWLEGKSTTLIADILRQNIRTGCAKINKDEH